jgi:hypothetical protein
MLYFDRLLFTAVFAVLIGTGALGVAGQFKPAAGGADPAVSVTAPDPNTPSLERVVVIGQREASRS